jgi:competence protein ComEA
VLSAAEGPAKWAAVAILSAASGAGITWALIRGGRTDPAGHPLSVVVAPGPAPQGEAMVQLAPSPPAPMPKVQRPVVEPAAIAPPQAPADAPAKAPANTPTAGRLNINIATAAELELLPDVGPALAKRIIEYRRAHGAFKTVEDLDNVPGIGPKTLEKLRPLVCVP